MILPTLVYNLLMLLVDVAVLRYIQRRRTMAAWCLAALCGSTMAVILAGLTSMLSPFYMFRLAAYGLFLHGAIVLVGSVCLLWRTRRKTAAGMAALTIIFIGATIDAFLIEPTWLEVSRVQIVTPKVDRRTRIVFLADLQADRFGSYERESLRLCLSHQPDLILLGGDYLQASPGQRPELYRQLNAFLREIEFGSRVPVFAVEGNIDQPDWTTIFNNTPITAVSTRDRFEAAGISLTCLSESESRDTSLAIESPIGDPFHIVLGHRPDFAMGSIEADLLLAGHTHGGQIQLPLIGPLLKLSPVPRSWATGTTDLGDERTLIVSRGVGMERGSAPRLRFLCRPQLVIIDLVPPKR